MPLCTRKVGCIKEAGHPGWCKTKASKTKAVSQDDMLAAAAAKESLPSKRRAVSSSAVARAGGFRELSERHNAKKSRRTIAVCSDDEEYEDQGSEEYEAESDEGDTEWGGGGGRRPSRATGSGGVEYADHGMSRNERKAARSAGARRERYEEEGDGSEDEGAEYSGGPAAALHEVESIRLRRSALEKWLLEPFFSTVVRGCLVRIGLQVEAESGGGQSGAQTLYRVAEVVGVEEFEDQGYMLGARKTHKKLKLRFGEIDQWHAEMAPPCRSWQMTPTPDGKPDEVPLRAGTRWPRSPSTSRSRAQSSWCSARPPRRRR